MNRQELKKAYRNAWILTVLGIGYVLFFCYLALVTNSNPAPVKWDMGGVSFVPASSQYGNEYYSPVVRPGKKDQ